MKMVGKQGSPITSRSYRHDAWWQMVGDFYNHDLFKGAPLCCYCWTAWRNPPGPHAPFRRNVEKQ